MTQAPTPGPLSGDDVKLLVKDDLLRHREGLFSFLRPRDKHQVEGERAGEKLFDRTEAFTFIGRPDADGWMPWSGGENPVPGRMVDQKFVDGETLGELSDDCGWKDKSLIAFRLAPTAPVEASGSEREAMREALAELKRIPAPLMDDGEVTSWDARNEVAAGIHAAETWLERALNLRPQPSGSERDGRYVAGEFLPDSVQDGRPQPRGETREIDRKWLIDIINEHSFACDAADMILERLSARPLALGGQNSGGERGWPTVMDALEATDQNWIVAKGRLTEDEPPYGCQILDGEDVIAEGECSTLSGAVSAALADLNGNTTPAEAQDEGAAGEPVEDKPWPYTPLADALHDHFLHTYGLNREEASESAGDILDLIKKHSAHPSPPPAASGDQVREWALIGLYLVEGRTTTDDGGGIKIEWAFGDKEALFADAEGWALEDAAAEYDRIFAQDAPPAADEDRVRIADTDAKWLARWLGDQKEGGHCGEGNVERRERAIWNDQIERILAALKSTAAKEGEKS